MRKFEAEYRLNEGDDVLLREDAIHRDLDLRVDAIERIAEEFRVGNRLDVDALVHNIDTTFSKLAGEMRTLLDATTGGFSADVVHETTERLFLTAARRASILAELRGGADPDADTLGKLSAALLQRPTSADVATAIRAAIDALKGGASAAYDTLKEIEAYILNDMATATALVSAMANRVRFDAAQTLSASEAAQARANIGAAGRDAPTFTGAASFQGDVALSGNLGLAGTGTNRFQAGPGDGATYDQHNVRLQLWYGLGISTYDGTVKGVYDARAGRWDTKAAPRVDGRDVWHPGNFDPGSKVDHGGAPRFSGFGTAGNETWLYSDVASHNFVIRTGPASAYRYSVFGSDGFFTSPGGGRFYGDLTTTGHLIVGEGKDHSFVEMRDTNDKTRYVHNNDGAIGFVGGDGGWKFRVFDDGNWWSPAYGYLSDIVADKNARVAKAGDTMTGDLLISKAYAATILLWGNVIRAGWMLDSDGSVVWRNFDSGAVYLRIRTSGAVETAQIGDLNSRIEQRAADFANDRASRITARMSFAGDVSMDKRDLYEPWGGAVVTGYAGNNGVGYCTNLRFRYLQMRGIDNNWYTVGYV